jgi:hypothetical protein
MRLGGKKMSRWLLIFPIYQRDYCLNKEKAPFLNDPEKLTVDNLRKGDHQKGATAK